MEKITCICTGRYISWTRPAHKYNMSYECTFIYCDPKGEHIAIKTNTIKLVKCIKKREAHET